MATNQSLATKEASMAPWDISEHTNGALDRGPVLIIFRVDNLAIRLTVVGPAGTRRVGKLLLVQ